MFGDGRDRAHRLMDAPVEGNEPAVRQRVLSHCRCVIQILGALGARQQQRGVVLVVKLATSNSIARLLARFARKPTQLAYRIVEDCYLRFDRRCSPIEAN